MSVGIDIGSTTIKVVELSPEGARWRLRASGVIGYSGQPPEKATVDREMASLASAIRKLYREARISSKEVAIAIPEAHSFIQTIKFPPLTDSEIASAVKWEAEQIIPIPVSDAIIQHQVLERRTDAIPPEVLVLLVAAPKALVEKYVKVVQMAGLDVSAVETELIALVRAVAPPDQNVLVVDFGASSTDLAFAKAGQLYFSHSIATGGDSLTRAIAKSLGVDVKQAEEYKRTYGLSGKLLEGKVKHALDPVFRSVVDEIKKAIHFRQSEERSEPPKLVILSGGTAGMPEAGGKVNISS